MWVASIVRFVAAFLGGWGVSSLLRWFETEVRSKPPRPHDSDWPSILTLAFMFGIEPWYTRWVSDLFPYWLRGVLFGLSAGVMLYGLLVLFQQQQKWKSKQAGNLSPID